MTIIKADDFREQLLTAASTLIGHRPYCVTTLRSWLTLYELDEAYRESLLTAASVGKLTSHALLLSAVNHSFRSYNTTSHTAS